MISMVMFLKFWKIVTVFIEFLVHAESMYFFFGCQRVHTETEQHTYMVTPP